MFAEATAFDRIKDVGTNPSLSSAQKIDMLKKIATESVMFRSREDADDIIGALLVIAENQPDARVRFAALEAMQDLKAREDKEIEEGLLDDDDDGPPGISDDDIQNCLYHMADETTHHGQKKSLTAGLLAIARNDPDPDARQQAARTLGTFVRTSPAAIPYLAGGIPADIDALELHRPELHAPRRDKKCVDGGG